jgi:formiminotetrahydrofolate cyclodeaminase
MLSELSVTALLDAFASSDPTPGGGSAAALTGAVGASLLAMVAGLPKTKTGAPEEREALDAARVEILEHRDTLIQLIDRDTAAYDLVVAAYKKPKSTDDEKAVRSAAIQEALTIATEVPAETYTTAEAVVLAAQPVAQFGNPSAQSDIFVGLQLMGMAAQGALLNVEVNIGSIKDQTIVNDITRTLRATHMKAVEARQKTFDSSGLFDLLRKISARIGSVHGQPALASDDPRYHAQYAAMATEGLFRLGSSEARQALQTLARSSDEVVTERAKRALDRLDGKAAS